MSNEKSELRGGGNEVGFSFVVGSLHIFTVRFNFTFGELRVETADIQLGFQLGNERSVYLFAKDGLPVDFFEPWVVFHVLGAL